MSFDFSQFPRLEIGGKRVKKITRKSDGLVLWEAGYINMVPLSINSDGTIYNGTGYQDGYRLSSSGAAKTEPDSVVSGFIPVSSGDVIRLAGVKFSSGYKWCYVDFYDESFNFVCGGGTQDTDTGVLTNFYPNNTFFNQYASVDCTKEDSAYAFAVSLLTEDIKYFRLNGVGNGANMIVTVNEEIT